MKNIIYPIVLVFLISCNYSGKNSENIEDSLDYYPPTPKEIPKPVFRHYFNTLQHHFDSLLLKSGFSGQILIAKNGTVLFQKTNGFADFRTKDSLTVNSSLHIASVSKTFTSMAILYLMEKGKLNLDDTLGTFFPGFPYQGITIKMLLSHRSGLPNYLNYLSLLKNTDTCYSNQDVLHSLFTLHPNLYFKSGTRFGYSNTNFVLLAMILEKVTGELFPAYMKKVFFNPLKMTNTFVFTNTDSIKATPSFDWNGKYWNPDSFDCTYGDKNIYSTVTDLLKWDQALYNGRLFKKETLDSAFEGKSNETKSVHNYGLGWRMVQYPDKNKVIYHNGRWHGSNASFARLPDAKATIIVIGNKFNRNIYGSVRSAYNIFGNYLPGFEQESEEDLIDTPEDKKTKNPFISKKNLKSVKTKR